MVSYGPFDIQGGGLGFFLATSYFFLSFCTTSYFFSKVNCNKFFIFLKKNNNTLKSEKCPTRKQHTE